MEKKISQENQMLKSELFRENYFFSIKILEIFYLASLGIVNANIVGEFTASAVHKQIVVEESFWKKLQLYPICLFLENFWNLIKKFCKNSNVINQSKCSSGILEHGTKCQTTCDDIRHEMICSCWRIFGPIQDCFHSWRINKE